MQRLNNILQTAKFGLLGIGLLTLFTQNLYANEESRRINVRDLPSVRAEQLNSLLSRGPYFALGYDLDDDGKDDLMFTYFWFPIVENDFNFINPIHVGIDHDGDGDFAYDEIYKIDYSNSQRDYVPPKFLDKSPKIKI